MVAAEAVQAVQAVQLGHMHRRCMLDLCLVQEYMPLQPAALHHIGLCTQSMGILE
jgi:hypothetical protein